MPQDSQRIADVSQAHNEMVWRLTNDFFTSLPENQRKQKGRWALAARRLSDNEVAMDGRDAPYSPQELSALCRSIDLRKLREAHPNLVTPERERIFSFMRVRYAQKMPWFQIALDANHAGKILRGRPWSANGRDASNFYSKHKRFWPGPARVMLDTVEGSTLPPAQTVIDYDDDSWDDEDIVVAPTTPLAQHVPLNSRRRPPVTTGEGLFSENTRTPDPVGLDLTRKIKGGSVVVKVDDGPGGSATTTFTVQHEGSRNDRITQQVIKMAQQVATLGCPS
jgi:hypothetical protein